MPSGSKAPRKEPWWSRESAPLPATAAVASDVQALGWKVSKIRGPASFLFTW
jgi:hypothetical protein